MVIIGTWTGYNCTQMDLSHCSFKYTCTQFTVICKNCTRMVHGYTQTSAHCNWMGVHGVQMDIYKIPILTQFLHFFPAVNYIHLILYGDLQYNRLWPWWPIKSSIQRCCSWSFSLEMKGMRLHLSWKFQTQIWS